jgi:hypothetical protein
MYSLVLFAHELWMAGQKNREGAKDGVLHSLGDGGLVTSEV